VQDSDEDSDRGESRQSDDEKEVESNVRNSVLGKDKVTVWSLREPNMAIRRRPSNIVKETAGPRDASKKVTDIAGCWSLFITDSMIEIITKRSNETIQLQRANWSDTTQILKTCETEIKALIGLLYLAEVMKANRHNLDDLWSTDGTGVEIFRDTMSLQRFKFLLSCLRFDDASSREARKAVDKLAPIRDLFEDFRKLHSAIFP